MTVACILAVATAIAAPRALVASVGGPPEDPAYLAVYAAAALQTVEAEGARLALHPAPHPTAAIRALRDGTAAVAVTTTDRAVRAAWAQGDPVRILVTHTRAPAATLLVSTKHRNAVSAVRDLRGKRVGIPGPGTTGHLLLAALLGRHGIEPWEAELVSLGGGALVGRLGTGELAAAIVEEPWTTRALETGGAAILLDLRRPGETVQHLGGPFYEVVSVVPAAEAGPREPMLAAFVRALIRVQTWLATAPPQVVASRLPRRLVGDRARFIARLTGLRGTYAPDGTATERGLTATLRILRGGSPWPARLAIRPRDLLPPAFVAAARAELGPVPLPP